MPKKNCDISKTLTQIQVDIAELKTEMKMHRALIMSVLTLVIGLVIQTLIG